MWDYFLYFEWNFMMSLLFYGVWLSREKYILDSERGTKKVLDEEEGILPYAEPGTRRQEQ